MTAPTLVPLLLDTDPGVRHWYCHDRSTSWCGLDTDGMHECQEGDPCCVDCLVCLELEDEVCSDCVILEFAAGEEQ